MFDKTQLLKGSLEGCILKVISFETTYGYEIIEKLTEYGFQNVKEGTIYPLLVRLENKELITSQLKPSPLGPKRKYYSITATGQQWLGKFEENWAQLNEIVERIFNTEGGKK